MATTQIKQKRIKLESGKTLIVDVAVKKTGNPLKEAANIISKYPFIQPCD